MAIAVPSAHATGPVGVQNGLPACGGVRNGNGDVYTVNSDGSRLRWLTENDVPDGDPAWSPSGHHERQRWRQRPAGDLAAGLRRPLQLGTASTDRRAGVRLTLLNAAP